MIEKPTWIIHNVLGYDNLPEEDFDYFGNFHTHGLNEYGHKELCLCINIEPKLATGILNTCGLMIANDKEVFKGVSEKVLEGGYKVYFEEFPNDPVLYIYLPDANNRLPQDEDCNPIYKMQKEYAKYISKNELTIK